MTSPFDFTKRETNRQARTSKWLVSVLGPALLQLQPPRMDLTVVTITAAAAAIVARGALMRVWVVLVGVKVVEETAGAERKRIAASVRSSSSFIAFPSRRWLHVDV